jgi:hypothetical protein
MNEQFEVAGDFADWPKNEPNKPTQAAVFGAYHPKRGKVFELLWTGQFPDLEKAMYWAAKKELEAVRKGKWEMASRILWQHGLAPEQALESVKKHMSPQIDRVLKSWRGGGEIDVGTGPLHVVDPSKCERYVEVVSEETGQSLGSFIVPPDEDDDEDAGDGRGRGGGRL